jgi:hypothetical protein
MGPDLDHGTRLDQGSYLLPALAVELEALEEQPVLLGRPATLELGKVSATSRKLLLCEYLGGGGEDTVEERSIGEQNNKRVSKK